MTTKVKDNKFYFLVAFKAKDKNQKQSVMLTHLRLYDSKLLQNIVTKLPDPQFDAIKEAIKNLL